MREAIGSVKTQRIGSLYLRPVVRIRADAGDAFCLYLPMGKSFDWCYASEPEPNMDNRRLARPRGRVLGGSSSINGMVYVRGNARDFDRWAEMGATGWDYQSVLPYFKKAQRADEGRHSDNFRGSEGSLGTTTGAMKTPYGAFLRACKEAGHATPTI